MIAAYGAYELLSIWAKREGRLWQPKKSRRYWRQALTVSFGLGLGITYGLGLLATDPHNNPGIGRFLGTGWAGTERHEAANLNDYFPPITMKSGDRPAYIFLHPDFPPHHLAGLEKKSPQRRPTHRPKSCQPHSPKKMAQR
jgi:hypothetical protein